LILSTYLYLQYLDAMFEEEKKGSSKSKTPPTSLQRKEVGVEELAD